MVFAYSLGRISMNFMFQNPPYPSLLVLVLNYCGFRKLSSPSLGPSFFYVEIHKIKTDTYWLCSKYSAIGSRNSDRWRKVGKYIGGSLWLFPFHVEHCKQVQLSSIHAGPSPIGFSLKNQVELKNSSLTTSIEGGGWMMKPTTSWSRN